MYLQIGQVGKSHFASPVKVLPSDYPWPLESEWSARNPALLLLITRAARLVAHPCMNAEESNCSQLGDVELRIPGLRC